MPRLTDRHYIAVHAILRQWWLQVPLIYGELSAREQWYLHDYFRPCHDDNDLALLAPRRRVSQQRPSLPHCAGRAWHHFQAAVNEIRQLAQQPAEQTTKRTIHTVQNPRRPQVTSVVRPEPDVERIARMLIHQIMVQVESEEPPQREAG